MPYLICPAVLEYWEWIFNFFNLERLLGIQEVKGVGRREFGWEECKHFLRDPVFYYELVFWSMA